MTWAGHERALAVLGFWELFSLATGLELPLAKQSLYGLVLYMLGLTILREPRARLVVTYGFVLWMYWHTTAVSKALWARLWDDRLLRFDAWLLGTTPALTFTPRPWLTEVMSACYQTYLVYLHVSLVQVLLGPAEGAQRWGRRVFPAFAVGLWLYTIVPAVGPGAAFPELFARPLTGGPMTQVNDAVIAAGNSAYGTFPSLHVLITLCLLEHDWQFDRRRFRVFALPAIGLFASTVYLRYHYFVDLWMGFLIWAWLALRRA